MTNHNGYVLEQRYSPLVVLETPAFEELRELGRGCITRPTVRHKECPSHWEGTSAPPEQQAQVVALSKALGGMVVAKRRAPKCQLVGPKGEAIPLPESVFYVLERVAEVLARGDSITVVPVGREVTTQQAADLLNVSRQYLVRLLDEGRIPFRKTGKHRRLRIEDVLTFKEKRDKDRACRASRALANDARVRRLRFRDEVVVLCP